MSNRSSAAAVPAIHDRVEAARALHAQGRTAEALELLNRPGVFTQEAYTLRGDLHFALGQLQEALGGYSAALALGGARPELLQRLANCLARLKRWSLATEAFRQWVAADPESDPARIGLGNCLLHTKNPSEALASFEACRSGVSRLPTLFGKAVALQLLQRFDEAEILYEQFLQVHPTSEEALSNLIAMRMEVLDLTRVRQYALRLQQIAPRSVVAMQALALVAFERREYQEAARWVAELQAAAPDGTFSPENENPEHVIYRLSADEVEFLRTFRDAAGASLQQS